MSQNKTRYYFHDARFPEHRWHMDNTQLMHAFGVTSGRWPDAGMHGRTIMAVDTHARCLVPVFVFVKPITRREDGRKSSTHRALCVCPNCHAELSTGRLHQHVCAV